MAELPSQVFRNGEGMMVEERKGHLCTLQGHSTGSLWEPLVPANGYPYHCIPGFEHLEPCVSRAEVKLLLVPATVMKMKWLLPVDE